MNVRPIPFVIPVLITTALLAAEPIPNQTVSERIAAREFPSVFQAWNPADNLQDEDQWATLARHDLVFHAPDFFALKWAGEFQGLSMAFTQDSQESGLRTRKMLLGKNPNLIILAELRYRDAHKSYLPDNHAWWQRTDGKPVIGWEEGEYFLLDFSNSAFRRHLAQQASAVMDSGVFDGLMLDWWEDDEDRLALVNDIRMQIGDQALILVNANDRKTPTTAPFVNGYFMECYKSKTVEDWKQIAETLEWAESNLKEPRINCIETWFCKSRNDLSLMRATTTLSLTLSDGYCLFSDPNPLPTPDHLHDWYDFWMKRLGRPKAKGDRRKDGSIQREFDQGLVVYNPLGGKPVTLDFTTPHTAASSNKTAMTFMVSPGDGDLFLREAEK